MRLETIYTALPVPRLNRWVALALAIALVTMAIAVRRAIGTALPGAQFITLAPVVIFASYLSGLAIGLFAVGFSAFAIWYFVLPPGPGIWHTDIGQIFALAAYIVDASLGVLLVSAFRASLSRVSDLSALMSTTFDAHPDGVMIVNTNGAIVDCNGRARAMFGEPNGALIGTPLEALLPERFRASHARRVAAFWADPVPRAMGSGLGLIARRADGAEFPVDIGIGVLRLRDRQLVLATIRDITDQRAANAALAESLKVQAALEERARNAEAARRWADAFQNAAFGIAIWDAATETVQVANPALAVMGGLTVQAAQGRPILDCFVPDERARVAAEIAAADRTGHNSFESMHQCADGSAFPVQMHVTSVGTPDGTVRYRIATAQDITERKRAEALADALHETDSRFRQIFDESPIGMVLATAGDYRFVRINNAFARMLGRPVADILGRTRDEFAHPDDRNMPQPLRPGTQVCAQPADKRFIHASGRIVTAQVSVVALGSGAAGQDLVLGMAQDVTPQRQTEAALRQSQRMEAVGSLAGGMAHDFNNLLAIVIGNLDSIVAVAPVPEIVSTLIHDALGAALRGAELTRSLLAFARRQPLRPTELDLNTLIVELAGLVGRLLREDVTVSLDLASDVSPVTADRAQLEAALVNLASNARDAMPNGGTLRIATENRVLGVEYCRLHPGLRPGGYVMIEVSDTGTGMLPEVVSRVYEPFFTTKAADKGTGLGLSMVFGFVQQSGGHIDVASEPGIGTAFRLYLPRSAPAGSAEPTLAAPVSEPRGDGVTVLVVEDNASLRRIVTRQLNALGYKVKEAGDAASALAVLAEGPVDLLFSDIVMPGGMNGFELAERAGGLQPGLKVVLTSGYPQQLGHANAAAPSGTHRLLQKPYRKQEIARVLRETLES